MDGQRAASGVAVDGLGAALQAADVTFRGMRFSRPTFGLDGAAVAALGGAQVGFVFELPAAVRGFRYGVLLQRRCLFSPL